MFEKRVRPLLVVCVVLAAGCVVGTTFALYYGLRSAKVTEGGGGDAGGCGGDLPPSSTVQGAYWEAAVAANSVECSRIGSSILMKGGSAVEAAVAALLCEGVANPQSMGVGGGFLMTIYNRHDGSARVLNARETAPEAAFKDMYDGNATLKQMGGLSVAVPGELKGYEAAVQQYGSGNVTWEELVMPTVKLCEEGIPVSAYVANIFKSVEDSIRNTPSLGEILLDNGKLLQEGDLMKRPRLAETLTAIAKNGSADPFYYGEIGDMFLEDLDEFGGIITKDDLEAYKVKWAEPVTATLSNGNRVYSVPPPGSGALITFILNILNDWIPADDLKTTWQRIIEAFKFAYGRRTEMGDPDFEDMYQWVKDLTSVKYAGRIRAIIEDNKTSNDPKHYGAETAQPENHGTAHISVLAPNGDAVSVTSTVNLILGAKIRSRKTGIIFNDEMDDFAAPNITDAFGVPPSPANFIAPGKRPVSSMCPTIVTDALGAVRFVAGAAGGTKITTATALSIINNLWFKMSVKESVDARRLHHQIFPMTIQYEEGFSENILKSLRSFDHKTEESSSRASVTAIAVNQSAPYQKIFASSDFRRLGAVAGF